MALDNNLQSYADSTVELMSPIKKESAELKAEAEALEITDAETLKAGVDLRKKAVKHIKVTGDRRMDFTRPLQEVTKQLIAGERDVLEPAEEAKSIIGKKIMDYEAEQERLAEIERQRIAQIVEQFNVSGVVYSKKITLIEQRGKELKDFYGKLPEVDQENPTVKLEFTQAVNRLLEAKDILSRAQIDDAERAKAQAQRDAAEVQARAEAEAAPKVVDQPKTGARTVTKFEVTNSSLVPRIYCMPVDSLIREAIKNGVTDIAGVRIYQERSF